MELSKKLIKLYGDVKGQRANWDSHWQELADYIIPRRDNVYYKPVGGERKGEKVFDASPRHYNELLASALHSMLTNPSTHWFELTTGNPELDKDQDVRDYLQKLVKKIHRVLNNSNFQTEVHEVYLDLGSIGTSALRVEEDDDLIIRFHARPIYEYHILENFKGEVDTYFTERELTIRQIIQEFGSDKLPEEMKRDMLKKYKILDCVMPRKDVPVGRKSFNKPYASYSILIDKEIILKESGFNEFPILFPRWNKISGEIYGRSPGMKALPDIKMINAMMRDVIRAAQKVTDPPLLVPDSGILGQVNMTPGGLNFYRAGSPDRIEPVLTRGNPGLGFDVMSDVRERIKQAFFIDQLQLVQNDRMTATEVNQRIDEQLRLLGPLLGRLHFEFLQPLIGRILGIMKRKNELPENLPEALGKAQLQVFYSSQIAKSLRLSEGMNFQRFLEGVIPMAQMSPQILDIIDFDEAVKFNAGVFGVSEDILRNSREVKKLRQERQQQEAKMQEQQDAMVQAETANKMAPMLNQ